MTKPPALRFRFRQIGPIKDAELQLGRLTVIAGRNNSGKTYVLNALYGLVMMWRQVGAIDRAFSEHPALSEALEFLREGAEKGYARRKVATRVFHKERMILLDAMSAAYSDALDRVFGAPVGSFAGASVSLALDPPREGSLIAQGFERRAGDESSYMVRAEPDGVSIERVESIRVESQQDGDEPTANEDQPTGSKTEPQVTLQDLQWLYVVFAFPELRFVVQQLPAEAAAVSLFQPDVDFNRSRIVELLRDFDLASHERESAATSFLGKATSRYALLVKDAIDSARHLFSGRHLPHVALRDGVTRMMDGEYETDGQMMYFRSRENAASNFRIPLPMASTSARSLASLYDAEMTDGFHHNLLLVDEPDAFLDTRNQVVLARVLARLVRSGVHVLIATHSDYLIKEFNNLIMLSRDFKDKKAAVELLGYRWDEFLQPYEVCAFVAENGGLTRCEVDAYGMNMPIFDETIDSINSAANLLAARVVG